MTKRAEENEEAVMSPCDDIAPFMMHNSHLLPLQHANTIDFPATFALPRCKGEIFSKKNRLFSLKFFKKQQQHHRFQHVPLERFKTIEPTQSTLDYRMDRIVRRLEVEQGDQDDEVQSVNTCPASLAASLVVQLQGMAPVDLLGEYPKKKKHRKSLKQRLFGDFGQ